MDSLTLAIEAYISTLNSSYTEPLALPTIVIVIDDNKGSYNRNMDARQQMYYVQCLAGMAFSNALYSIAHKTGTAFNTGHIPHSCANTIYLPYVIQYNAKEHKALKRYVDISKR